MRDQPFPIVALKYNFNEKSYIEYHHSVYTPVSVEGQEHGPIELAIFSGLLLYRYKFLSQVKDKNLYRLPEWTRT